MLSPRTAKYVAALIREGDKFDYYGGWLKRVREEESQASHVPTAFSSGELVAAGMGIPINTSHPYPSITPRQALPAENGATSKSVKQVNYGMRPVGKLRKLRLRYAARKDP